MSKVYNKLVRDKIPEIIRAAGEESKTRILDDDKYEMALVNKLDEEVTEFKESGSAEELVDILEVVLALGALRGYSAEQLDQLRLAKAADRGAFEQRIFLVSTE